MAEFPPHTDPKIPVPELALYLKGELPPVVRAAFEAHLPTCDRCRKAVTVAQSIFPTVPQPAAPAQAAPTAAELVAMMDAQLAQSRARNQRRQEARSRNALIALAVVALLACISAFAIFKLSRSGALEAVVNPTGGHVQP
jgi:anti-sigma factor RsiW